MGPSLRLHAEFLKASSCSGMYGEDDGLTRGKFCQPIQDVLKGPRVINIRRPMQRQERIGTHRWAVAIALAWALCSQLHFVQDGRSFGFVFECQERINHGVADKMDLVGRNSLVPQILDRALFGHKEQIGNLIGEKSVDLFGHRPIERAQTRFHVHDQRPGAGRVAGDFGSDQRARKRRIHIPDQNHGLRPLNQEQRLKFLHHFRRLEGV